MSEIHFFGDSFEEAFLFKRNEAMVGQNKNIQKLIHPFNQSGCEITSQKKNGGCKNDFLGVWTEGKKLKGKDEKQDDEKNDERDDYFDDDGDFNNPMFGDKIIDDFIFFFAQEGDFGDISDHWIGFGSLEGRALKLRMKRRMMRVRGQFKVWLQKMTCSGMVS